MYGRVSSNYNRVGIETADQKTLILICYDEAISSLQRGRECFLNQRFEEKARHYNRAQDFIAELSSSLNLEAGGEIAVYLRKIYQFIQTNILMADVKKDIKIIDNLIFLLTELRSAWAELDTRPTAGLAYSKNQVVPEAARGFAV